MNIKELKRKTILETLCWVVATWFGAGCSPKAPGTVGSLFALPMVAVGIMGGMSWLVCGAGVLFLLGWGATYVVLKSQKEQDPGFVVIDEVVGQMLTFLWVLPRAAEWPLLVAGFALFRLFDIIKLWPASYFDKYVHNAFGVMADDVVAGLYAAIALYGLSFVI